MNQSSEKQRIIYIDYFKALAMILVILGHINFANQSIKPWIYSFHMPAFFFVTGIVLKEKEVDKHKLLSIIGKYFYRLLIPYILWGLIFSKFSLLNSAKIFYGSYNMISSAGSLTSLWFLPVMFLCVILFYTLIYLVKQRFSVTFRAIFAVFCFVVGLLLPQIKYGYPFSVNIVFVAFGFILTGNLAGIAIQKCKRNILLQKKSNKIIICIILSILFFAGTVCYQANIPDRGNILMGKADYGNPFLFVLVAICGCGMLLSISILIAQLLIEKMILFHMLSWFGQNTLVIFVVQKPIIQLFEQLFSRIHLSIPIELIITGAGTAIIASLICLLINKFVPILAGKQQYFCQRQENK